MSKPTNKPNWNPSDSSKIVEPSSTKKSQGWSSGEKPAAEHFNWLMKTVSEWIDYVDTAGVKGDKGDKGDTGEAGPQGLQGIQGEQGPAGSVDSSTLNTINSRIDALESATGVVQMSPVTITFPYSGGAAPSEYDAGDVYPQTAKNINWQNGASQYLLLNANCAISMTHAVAGNIYYLRIQQNGTGNRIVTSWPTSIVWKNGVVPEVSAEKWVVDVVGLYFDGQNYYGEMSKGYYRPPTPLDSKNAYVATVGGNVNKFNFSNDDTLLIINTYFGLDYSAIGAAIYPSNSSANGGQQSAGASSDTNGYKMGSVYNGNSALNGKIHKIAFSNDTTNAVGFFNSAWMSGNAGGAYARQLTRTLLAAYKMNTPNAVNGSPYLAKFLFSTETTTTSAQASTYNAYYGFSPSNTNANFGTPVAFSNSIRGVFVNKGTNAATLYTGVYIHTFATDVVAQSAYYSNQGYGSVTASGTYTQRTGDGINSEYFGYAVYNNSPITTTINHSLNKMDLTAESWSVVYASITGTSEGMAKQSGVSGVNNGYFFGGYSANTNSDIKIKKLIFSSDSYSTHTASLQLDKNNNGGADAACFTN